MNNLPKAQECYKKVNHKLSRMMYKGSHPTIANNNLVCSVKMKFHFYQSIKCCVYCEDLYCQKEQIKQYFQFIKCPLLCYLALLLNVTKVTKIIILTQSVILCIFLFLNLNIIFINCARIWIWLSRHFCQFVQWCRLWCI